MINFSRLLFLPITELVLSEEYVLHVFQDKDALINDELHVSNITCESDPLSISGMSSKDVVTRPFDAKCLRGFSSLLPSVEKPDHLYRSEEDNVDF